MKELEITVTVDQEGGSLEQLVQTQFIKLCGTRRHNPVIPPSHIHFDEYCVHLDRKKLISVTFIHSILWTIQELFHP